MSLLRNDRSSLSRDDWDLISNIIHAHDATEILPTTKLLLESQSVLPLKMRLKTATILHIHKQFFLTFLPYIQRSRFFHELSSQACEELAQNNFHIFGVFHGGFIIRELNGMSYPTFRESLSVIYSENIDQTIDKFTSRLDSDCALMKIILMLLAFSTNCGMVTFNASQINSIVGNSISIMNIQNTIASICWKYLLYQYGFVIAVHKFSSHIKYLLDVLKGSYEQENSQNAQTVNQIVNDTKRTLIIND